MSIQYRYDELNRLVAAVYDNGQEISYAYDAAGNRISSTVKGAAAPMPSYSSPQEQSHTFTEVTPPKKLGQAKPPANTSRRPPPPETLDAKKSSKKPPPPERLV